MVPPGSPFHSAYRIFGSVFCLTYTTFQPAPPHPLANRTSQVAVLTAQPDTRPA